jgi:hypothetical protein
MEEPKYGAVRQMRHASRRDEVEGYAVERVG